MHTSEIRGHPGCSNMMLDKALEDIAKIEVEAFLNQGKLLTDKHLKEVEISIKSKWLKQNGGAGYVSNIKKPDTYLPEYTKSNQKPKEMTSITPKVNGNPKRRFIGNNINTRNKYNNGYSNDRYKNCSRLNAASCEKLPYGNNISNCNNVSNSILVCDDSNRLITPISSQTRSRLGLVKNKSNISLHDFNDEKLLQINGVGA